MLSLQNREHHGTNRPGWLDARVEHLRRRPDRRGGVRGGGARDGSGDLCALGRGASRGRGVLRGGGEVRVRGRADADGRRHAGRTTHGRRLSGADRAAARGDRRGGPGRRGPPAPAWGDGGRRRGRRRWCLDRTGPRPDRARPAARRIARLPRQRLAPDGGGVGRPRRLPYLSACRSAALRPGAAALAAQAAGGRIRPTQGLEQAAALDQHPGSGDQPRAAPGTDERALGPRPRAELISTRASSPAFPTPTSRRPVRRASS